MTTVIEGEVVTSRRIERNAARTPEVLPPDVDSKVVAISRLDTPEMQTRAVATMLNHARTGLLAAIAAQDLPEIVRFKQKATAIHDIAKQVRLGKDIELDAAEFVRRAERGLGVAIRDGQERGEVTPSLGSARPTRDYIRDGKVVHIDQGAVPDKNTVSPSTFFSGGAETSQVYAMTDGVSDAQFEEAITEARDEGNLSRANVARKSKAKAQNKEPINADDPLIDAEVAPEPPKKKRLTKHDSTEMLANINGMLNGIVESIQFMDPSDIDATENSAVIGTISNSLGSIRKLLKEIKNG